MQVSVWFDTVVGSGKFGLMFSTLRGYIQILVRLCVVPGLPFVIAGEMLV